jgi:hypothetical protein
MNRWRRQSILGAVLATCLLGICLTAGVSVRAQQPVTTFDGVYDSTSVADPQNAIQCGPASGALAIVVKNGQFVGPDRKMVDVGPNGVAESDGRILLGGTATVPYKAVYRFAATSMDGDLTVTRLSSGVCIYHRRGTKRH